MIDAHMFPVFRRVGGETGHLAEIDQALAHYAKAKQIVGNFPMAPAPGASIASRSNAVPAQMPLQHRDEMPTGNESDAAIDTHVPVTTTVTIGTKVCRVTRGFVQYYAGYVTLGRPQYTNENGTVTITGFVEGKNKSRIQIRISGVQILTDSGKNQMLNDFQYNGSALSPNSIIWDSDSLWELCN
ncbi:MAG: hypothetical protein ACYC9P_05315 [Rudaea sp.]